MKVINVQDAKTHLSRLMEQVAAGEDIVLGKHGRPMARLTAYAPDKETRKLGGLENQIHISQGFDDESAEVNALFTNQAHELSPDTHVFLWALSAPEKLKGSCFRHPKPEHPVFISAVSSVEITIKQSLQLSVPENLSGEIEPRGFQHLPLTYEHGEQMQQLPAHHQDPFDRMLIAQAISESMILITHDKKMQLYPVKLLMISRRCLRGGLIQLHASRHEATLSKH